MKAEILMIGTELLLGQINDTNATYMGQELANHGINLFQKTTVGDNRERIIGALNNALDRSDVVLCSGGLGPTEDDITRECVAEVAGVGMEYVEDIFFTIEAMFARFGIPITENNKKQAMVPEGGLIIENPNGTAPGLMVECDRGLIFCLPGPPRELKPMLNDKVLPYLRDRFSITSLIRYRVVHILGIGESRVDEIIGDLMTDSQNPTVGVLASPASVRIRIAAKAESEAEADKLIDPIEAEVRKRFPDLVMGTNDDTIESVVDELLRKRGWSISVVETSSGGCVAQRMTGISAPTYLGGRVYPMETLDLGDVEQAALELADRCMVDFSSDSGLSIVSDPAAGITYAAYNHPNGKEVWILGRSGRSVEIQDRVALLALEHLRRFLVSAI